MARGGGNILAKRIMFLPWGEVRVVRSLIWDDYEGYPLMVPLYIYYKNPQNPILMIQATIFALFGMFGGSGLNPKP